LVEERRIQRQQEIERKRLEDEIKRQREKEVSLKIIVYKTIIKNNTILVLMHIVSK